MQKIPATEIDGRRILGEGVIRVVLDEDENLPPMDVTPTGLFHACDAHVVSPIDFKRDGSFGICRFCRITFDLEDPMRQ